MKTLILMPILFAAIVIASTSPAADHFWRWVDEDGVLTFSNNKPPAGARDATIIYSRYADNAGQMKTGVQDANRRPPEASIVPWGADPRSHPGTIGEVPVSGDQNPFDEFHAAGEDDCCVHYVDANPFDRFYTPYSDYAYSRRNYKGSWRYAKRYDADRPHYRHQHHHRHYHKRYPYGYRRYDRHYYRGSYRYHSRAPRYHHYGKKHYSRGYYGKKRYYRGHYGKKRYYRGIYGKKYHRGGYYGKRSAGIYRGGRHYRGGKTILGHAGYRGRSSHRMRR